MDQRFRYVAPYGEVREQVEVLKDQAELTADLEEHLLVCVYGTFFGSIAERIPCYHDLARIYLLESCRTAQKSRFAAA